MVVWWKWIVDMKCSSLFQTSITGEDAIIRVGFIHERGDLIDKDLLFIGDFDCLSIAAALTGLPRRIVGCFYRRFVAHAGAADEGFVVVLCGFKAVDPLDALGVRCHLAVLSSAAIVFPDWRRSY